MMLRNALVQVGRAMMGGSNAANEGGATMSMDEMKVLLGDVLASATGIRSTVEDMKTIHVDKIVGPGEQYGNDDVASAFHDFCDKWQGGVQNLVDDASSLADGLDYAVASYAHTDQDSARKLGIPIVPE